MLKNGIQNKLNLKNIFPCEKSSFHRHKNVFFYVWFVNGFLDLFWNLQSGGNKINAKELDFKDSEGFDFSLWSTLPLGRQTLFLGNFLVFEAAIIKQVVIVRDSVDLLVHWIDTVIINSIKNLLITQWWNLYFADMIVFG